MDDWRIVLDALLRRGDPEAAAYLNDPSSRPEVGRGRPIPRYQAQAPQRPFWPQATYSDPPRSPDYLIGPGAAVLSDRPPPVVRTRPLPPEHPGGYQNFADYANAVEGLVTAAAPRDREPWRSPIQTERMQVGEAAPRRGLEPPSAQRAPRPAPFTIEDEAWQAARARARASVTEDRARSMRRIPRPGSPLIAQAWADPDRRNRKGGR